MGTKQEQSPMESSTKKHDYNISHRHEIYSKRSHHKRQRDSSGHSSSRTPDRNYKDSTDGKRSKCSRREQTQKSDVDNAHRLTDNKHSARKGHSFSRKSTSPEYRRSDTYRHRESKHYNHRRYNDRHGQGSSFDHANAKWGKYSDDHKANEKDHNQMAKTKKDAPNFGLSGKLTEETNTYKGVVVKYSEPPEACKPRRRWRLYPFKADKALQTLYIHRESAYLIGRDRKVVDLPVDHPSCSKQHAALQYRLVSFSRTDGSAGKRVRPYLIDLESANGTYINNARIEPKKYVELLERDVIKFGYSSREYVLLHENSKDETLDDDVKEEVNENVVDPQIEHTATVKQEIH